MYLLQEVNTTLSIWQKKTNANESANTRVCGGGRGGFRWNSKIGKRRNVEPTWRSLVRRARGKIETCFTWMDVDLLCFAELLSSRIIWTYHFVLSRGELKWWQPDICTYQVHMSTQVFTVRIDQTDHVILPQWLTFNFVCFWPRATSINQEIHPRETNKQTNNKLGFDFMKSQYSSISANISWKNSNQTWFLQKLKKIISSAFQNTN